MEILKKSLKLYGQLILAGIMCFILVITFNMLGANLFGKQIGYSMQGQLENEENATILYDYMYEDGKDTKKQEYIDKGYELTEIPIKATTVAWDVIAQICLTLMMGIFVYNSLWKEGYADHNAVHLGRKAEDKLKGLKIGVIASLPSIIMLAAFVIGRNTFAKTISTATFSLFNPHLHRAIYLLTNSNGVLFSNLEMWKVIVIFAMLLFIPLVATVAYIIGYKSIVVSEKLIYKK